MNSEILNTNFDINDISSKNICNLMTSEVFDTFIADTEYFLNYLQKTCSGVYYISASSADIEKYKNHPSIVSILEQYHDKAQYENLEILVLKYNSEDVEKTRKRSEDLKKMYGDIVSNKVAECSFIVGYDGGSQGRGAKYLINELRKHMDFKNISIK